MAQINIAKTHESDLQPPGTLRKGYGFLENGTPIVINEDGTWTALGSSTTTNTGDYPIYTPTNSYLVGQLILYSSFTPGYTIPTIYKCVSTAELGESPETSPEKWQVMGTSIGTMGNVMYLTGYQETAGVKRFKKDLPFNQRFWGKPYITQSANTLASSSNFVQLTTNNNELQLFDTYLEQNYLGASVVIIYAKIGQKFKHKFASTNPRYVPYWLTQESDLVLESQRPILFYSLCNTDGRCIALVQIAETISIENTFPSAYWATLAQGNGYNVEMIGSITGWLTDELTDCTVDNTNGIEYPERAGIEIENNTSLKFTAGNLYGIKIYNSDGEVIHELACCENNVNVPYLHCSVTGRIFYITNVKTVIKQDTYFKCKDNGWQRVTITETGDIMDVAYLNDKITKIYN